MPEIYLPHSQVGAQKRLHLFYPYKMSSFPIRIVCQGRAIEQSQLHIKLFSPQMDEVAGPY